jgi:hypothetical protein
MKSTHSQTDFISNSFIACCFNCPAVTRETQHHDYHSG